MVYKHHNYRQFLVNKQEGGRVTTDTERRNPFPASAQQPVTRLEAHV